MKKTTITKERADLGRVIQAACVGHSAATSIAAQCDVLAITLMLASDTPEAARRLIYELMPDIEWMIDKNMASVKEQQARASQGMGGTLQ